MLGDLVGAREDLEFAGGEARRFNHPRLAGDVRGVPAARVAAGDPVARGPDEDLGRRTGAAGRIRKRLMPKRVRPASLSSPPSATIDSVIEGTSETMRFAFEGSSTRRPT